MANQTKSKLSNVSCEKCLKTGTMHVMNNVSNAQQVSCKCSNCAHNRVYWVIDTVRGKNNNIDDFIVDISATHNPVFAAGDPLKSNDRPSLTGDETMPQAKKNKRTKYHESTPSDIPESSQDNAPVAKSLKTYLDVLAYQLDQNGMPKKDDDDANRRFPDSEEDAAPQNESVMPRKERLEYRQETKPFQAVANSNPDYREIAVFSEGHPTLLSNTAKQNLLKESLEKDTEIVTAGLADASYVEPNGESGGQWCPKVRHSVPFYVCSHYCIDGRREPQDSGKFETYKDYLINGGNEFGKVFCGYKDWLKREVTGQYPGWVEDYIESKGGQISKNIQPFDHKMNLDKDQRRQMPVYPDHKLNEKRLDVEDHHKYKDQRSLTYASESVNRKIVKKSDKK